MEDYPNNISDIEENVYPMWQATTLAQEYVRDLHTPGMIKTLQTGLSFVDEVLDPMLEGSLVTVLGRPSNGKTLLGNYILLQTLNRLRMEQNTNEICILISGETSVEVTALNWLSRFSGIPISRVKRGELTPDELVKLDESVYQVIGLPFFIIGHSTQRSKQNRKDRPLLNPKSLNKALDFILNEYKNPITGQFYEPRLLVTDYLQRLQNPSFKLTERQFFNYCVSWAKDTALWTGAVHVLNVQAKREVDDREIKIPLMGDGMETAAIEHNSQAMFSVHMPKQYNIGLMPALTKWGIPELLVTKNLLYLTLLKQQEGESNHCWPLEIDFDRLQLHELNLSHHR